MMTLNNNFVFLNFIMDAMCWLWMLRYFKNVVNLAPMASVTTAIEEWYEWLRIVMVFRRGKKVRFVDKIIKILEFFILSVEKFFKEKLGDLKNTGKMFWVLFEKNSVSEKNYKNAF